MSSVTVTAGVNFALIKYWGKRDEERFLPTKSSISVTLEGLGTTATLKKSHTDDVRVFGESLKGASLGKSLKFLEFVKNKYNIHDGISVESTSTVPIGAGLASSASAFSAMAKGIDALFQLGLTHTGITTLARYGSGSASRSVCDGFAVWHRGQLADGTDSYAETIIDHKAWSKFRVVVVLVSEGEKKTSSRIGMKTTMATSPLYAAWVKSDEGGVPTMVKAIQEHNFSVVGQLTEESCLGMHSTMLTTVPSIIYWEPTTLVCMKKVVALREEKGISCYFTMDAGPNVKIITTEEHIPAILEEFDGFKTLVTQCGPGAYLA